jgi:CPA2 family monovalent cation:H+ antiporter-2
MHDLSVIITLAGALAVALVFGGITQRLGLTTLVGYMLAGVVVGPYTPGFVADTRLAPQMAEIGVILLMFGVGMHFHPQELLRVWRIALPGAVAQSAVAGAAGWALARWFGWSHAAGIVFGMALAVASTVVLMRMLVERDKVSTHEGHVAVGWLIVEDLFTVGALVVLPALAGDQSTQKGIAWALAKAIGAAGLFALLVWAVGTRFITPFIERVARMRSSELFTLTVFVVALGIAILAAEVFHVSVALGAFFAGLVVGQSRIGPQAAADMAPFRDVFSALFFVSVGMLFNPALLASQPGLIAASLGIVLIVKPLVALGIVMLLRDTRRTALTVAVGLAQIGEFSFILAALGQALGVLPQEGLDTLVIAAIASIAVNPLLFRVLGKLESRLPADIAKTETKEEESVRETLEGGCAVAVAGAREPGKMLARRCAESGVRVCLIDGQLQALEGLSDGRVATVFGDPGRSEVLRAAGLAQARMIVIPSGSLAEKMRICVAAREVNPRIEIVALADSQGERAWLLEFGAHYVLSAPDELSEALLRAIRGAL